MKFETVYDVAGGIVILAIVTSVVTSPKTADQITAVGKAFSGSISAALGRSH